METDTWEKVESLFPIAVELPFAERISFLQNECAGDGQLLSEVESLIQNFEQDSDILDESVFELGLGAISSKLQKNLANSVIGVYELQEKIGAGGRAKFTKRLTRD